MSKTVFVPSMKESELKEGQMKPVRIKGKAVLLVRVGGEVYGVSDRCPHEGCALHGGILTGYVVMCQCHGWKFDVRNGRYLEIPQVKLEYYRSKIENGRILVEIRNDKK
jgi:nitrite reductase/ring-hydroxylating ferredoxin subunit